MIEFKQVSLTYPYDEYAVLKDLTFTLKDGVNTILCDSQSGKSSICKLLTKEFAPTSGQIILDGRDIASITNCGLGILYLSAKPTFFEGRSVRYNVTYPLRVRKTPKTECNRIFDEVAGQFNITKPDVKVRCLTDDERRTVVLARSATVTRSIVLADDFCSSVEQIDEVIAQFGNATVVILTSDATLARGNVVVLDGGNTCYQGDADGAIKIRQTLRWIVDVIEE